MPDGGVIVGGGNRGTINFGDGVRGADGVFIWRLNQAGETVWSRQFNTTDTASLFGGVTSSAGRFAVSGQLRGTIDLGAGPIPPTLEDGEPPNITILTRTSSPYTKRTVRWPGPNAMPGVSGAVQGSLASLPMVTFGSAVTLAGASIWVAATSSTPWIKIFP